MIRRVFLALACLACAVPALAQAPQSNGSPAIEFLPRYAFHVSFEHLASEEERFVWDGNWGAELDIVDYGLGRFTFLANYQTILGSEFRAFDPNQGNYILEGSASARAPVAEFAAVFHHVSRHLSDRPKRFPVDWNMLGARIRRGVTRGRTEVQGTADLRGVLLKSYVDYRWELDTELRTRVGLSPRVAAIATGRFHTVGVDGSRNRGTQFGYRGEGGVQLAGRGALLDLFVAAERRIDPYQLEFSTASWLTAGFRISSR
jgi:hypothetical protein